MHTSPSRHPGLAQVSSSCRLILDSSAQGLHALLGVETSLTGLQAEARQMHMQAAAGELGDAVGLASAVGRTLEAMAPLVGLRETLQCGLDELREGLSQQHATDPA